MKICKNKDIIEQKIDDEIIIYVSWEGWENMELVLSTSRKIYSRSQREGLPRWLSGKGYACNAGDAGLIIGSGRCPGGENGNPL